MDHIQTQDESSKNLLLSSHMVTSYEAIIKELLENSLDASSGQVDIEINFNGVPNVKVNDDGSGMGIDCMKKLSNRYHSSKVFDEDSSRMISFGFRGEALSSIISMAKSVKIFSSGGSVLYDEGNLDDSYISVNLKVSGTTIIITDPFHRVPVRHRLLSENIPKIIVKMFALVKEYFVFNNVDIRFLTRYKDKERIIVLKAHENMSNRIQSLLNLPTKVETHKLKRSEIKFTIGENDSHFIAIKSRPVSWRRMSSLLKRLHDAYGIKIVAIDIHLMKGFDINVDPDKRNVFVSGEKEILHEIEDFLKSEHNKKIINPKKCCTPISSNLLTIEGVSSNSEECNCPLEVLEENIYRKESFEGFQIVGNFNNSFIIIKLLNNDFFLVDQHAADERVNLEKFEAEYKPEVQTLLYPIKSELDPEEAVIATDYSKEINSRLGFYYSIAKNDTITLLKAPIVGDNVLGVNELKEIFNNVKAEGRISLRQCTIISQKLASKACKSSIRLGDNIDLMTMKKVIHPCFNICRPSHLCSTAIILG